MDRQLNRHAMIEWKMILVIAVSDRRDRQITECRTERLRPDVCQAEAMIRSQAREI
jgi:hypothetical protein